MKTYLADTRDASKFYGAWSLCNLDSQLEGEKSIHRARNKNTDIGTWKEHV